MASSDGVGSKHGGLATLSPESVQYPESNNASAISVRSLWKVFGENPERVVLRRSTPAKRRVKSSRN